MEADCFDFISLLGKIFQYSDHYRMKSPFLFHFQSKLDDQGYIASKSFSIAYVILCLIAVLRVIIAFSILLIYLA